MSKLPVIHFKAKDFKVNSEEQKVLAKLIKAAEAIVPIYQKQENPKFPGANFYPHDVTNEEIIEAAKENPDILSPYTMVERDKKGKLFTIPYHTKFKKELAKTAILLREAAKLTKNKDFAHRLCLQANALTDGSYEISDIYWITMKPYKIDIAIGPIDRLDDRLMFKKASFEAWVGVIDDAKTKNAKIIQNSIYDVKRKIFASSEKANFLDKTQLRVDKTLIFSGLFARGMFTSNSLPTDPNLMERYGIKITFFDTSLDLKFNNQHLPIFKRIFEKGFQRDYSEEILKDGSFRNVLLHEIGHSLLRYKDAESRLRELFPIIDELSATIYGIKSCASLVLKGIISEKELEAIMIMFICRAFTWWIDSKKQPSLEAFAIGHALALNHFLANGAVQESNGISWPNFYKMFLGIEELSDALERLISIGTYNDAKHFIDKYGSFMIYSRFTGRLKGLV
ncbi:MAG: hypothetical protein Q8P25_02335 [Candidatus Curtissbacteria bacterium]|nr:hypothetical protein [Candidatus Curtissbacteria bacterium]